MSKRTDLHEQFIIALNRKLPKKDSVNIVADILKLEKDSAYRRLSGKVFFSVREIGILAWELDISLDQLLHSQRDYSWLPFILQHPLKVHSMDPLFSVIDSCLEQMEKLDPDTSETGNIYCGLPIEFYLYSPVLTKFMFFKWGHYFIGTDEFDNYARWELPLRVSALHERLIAAYHFTKAYYIWDTTLISSLVREISNLHTMRVITTDEMYEIKEALKDMLDKIEHTLNGSHVPSIELAADSAFYVSSVHLGFTSNYFMSKDIQSITFHTDFSFCLLDNNRECFYQLKEWVDSFRDISTLISHSGRIERRLFFQKQREIIDFELG